MTATPEKDSCEKSESFENAACRTSHFFIIYLPSTVADASNRPIGIRDRSVSPGFMRNILPMDSTPSSSASKNIMNPHAKHSCTVSRSFVNRLIRSPTLFT